jgi:hypothetical protein
VDTGLCWKSPIVADAGRQNRLAYGRDDAGKRYQMMLDVKHRQSAKLLPDEVRRRMSGAGHTLVAKCQRRTLACCCHTPID